MDMDKLPLIYGADSDDSNAGASLWADQSQSTSLSRGDAFFRGQGPTKNVTLGVVGTTPHQPKPSIK